MADRKQPSSTLKDILDVAKERRWKSVRRGRGRGERGVVELEADSGSDGSCYEGTDIGDAQVGEWSCVEKLRQEQEIGTGRVQVAPPPPGRKHAEGGEGRSGLRRVFYIKINDRA